MSRVDRFVLPIYSEYTGKDEWFNQVCCTGGHWNDYNAGERWCWWLWLLGPEWWLCSPGKKLSIELMVFIRAFGVKEQVIEDNHIGFYLHDLNTHHDMGCKLYIISVFPFGAFYILFVLKTK